MTWLQAEPLQEVFPNEGCDAEARGWDALMGQSGVSVMTWLHGDPWGTACGRAGDWVDLSVGVPAEKEHTQTGERF